MDTAQKTQDYVSYIFSRDVILKKLRDQGVISDSDFERYDQMLYDRYHIDIDLGVPRPIAGSHPTSSAHNISAAAAGKSMRKYISLTVIAREVNEKSPGHVIQNWLRDSNTVRFLRCWELENNPDFDDVGYDALLEEMKSPAVTLSVKKWVDATGAIGLQSKLGKNGGILAPEEIACAFRAWLNPEFQYQLVQDYLSAGGGWECRTR